MSWPSVPLMKQISLLAATTPSSPPVGLAGFAETAWDMGTEHLGETPGRACFFRTNQTPVATITARENGVNLRRCHASVSIGIHRRDAEIAERNIQFSSLRPGASPR